MACGLFLGVSFFLSFFFTYLLSHQPHNRFAFVFSVSPFLSAKQSKKEKLLVLSNVGEDCTVVGVLIQCSA